MSNKKQSSIEWLLQELTYDNGFGQRCISFTETVDLTPYFEQAKAMHNDEIAKAYDDAIMKGRQEDGNEYYNETYGGNNGHI